MTNDSSRIAFGNSTMSSTPDPTIVLIAAITVASFVLLSLIILCGIMVLIALFRLRSCKHVSTAAEELDTPPSPYYENINTIRPRVIEATYQDQEFELVDNVCYGPLPLSAIYSH